MDKQHVKRLRSCQRKTEAKNTHQFTQNNTKIIPNWKTPGHDGIHGFISIHDRLSIKTNRCLQVADVPE